MSLLPILILAVLFCTLATRLIRSGLRGQSSELWLGCFFALVGLSAPLRAAVAMGVDLGIDPALAAILGQIATGAGVACLNFFVWKVFRPDGHWGRALFYTLAATIALLMVLFVVLGAYARQSHPVNIMVVATMASSLGWAFSESLRYWRMMRKRVALGLGDEVIANRFGLWTLWTGAILAFPIFNLSVRSLALFSGSTSEGAVVTGEFAWAMDAIRGLALICGPTVVLGTWLIFFPPKRYLARIAARSAST